MGQKDDTRENSCVTESKKEIKRERKGEKEGGEIERGRKRMYGSVTTSQKAKSHNIDILVSISPNGDSRACARVYSRHASATKCI